MSKPYLQVNYEIFFRWAQAEIVKLKKEGNIYGHNVFMYYGPGENYKAIGYLPFFDNVTMEKSFGDWILVKTKDGKTGWVHSVNCGQRWYSHLACLVLSLLSNG